MDCLDYLHMEPLSTEKILAGLKELRDGMKKDEVLDKKFSSILEDSERRIRSCEWVDFNKVKPKHNIKALFKDVSDSKYSLPMVRDFDEEEERIKKFYEEDGYVYRDGEHLWKPFETERRMDIDEVWKGLCELREGFLGEEFLRKKYSNLIVNIMERVNSGEWNNFRGYKPFYEIDVIYKAKYANCDDYWSFGVSHVSSQSGRLINLLLPELYESIWWKPLNVEERA